MILTNMQIDNRLLNEAKQFGDHQTEWEIVNNALREYIQRRKRFVPELFSSYSKYDDTEKQAESPDDLLRELRNSVTEYKDPAEPVGLDDWEVLK